MGINKLLGVAVLCMAGSAFATPHIQHWQTTGGARVLFVEDHDIPMLDVAVRRISARNWLAASIRTGRVFPCAP